MKRSSAPRRTAGLYGNKWLSHAPDVAISPFNRCLFVFMFAHRKQDRRVGRKMPLSLRESGFQGGKTGFFAKRRARQRRARRPINQLASGNENSHEEADAANSRADRMTADVL